MLSWGTAWFCPIRIDICMRVMILHRTFLLLVSSDNHAFPVSSDAAGVRSTADSREISEERIKSSTAQRTIEKWHRQGK